MQGLIDRGEMVKSIILFLMVALAGFIVGYMAASGGTTNSAIDCGEIYTWYQSCMMDKQYLLRVMAEANCSIERNGYYFVPLK